MNRYPKAKYHATLPPALVQNAAEEDALGRDWFDHPNLVPKDSDESWEASKALLDAPTVLIPRRGRPPKVNQ